MAVPIDVGAGWRALGAVDPMYLIDSRLQLHHAAQIIVSAAISYLPRKDDDSHTNLEWLPDLRALATNVLPVASGLRFALRPEDLALLSIAGGALRSAYPLDGRTLTGGVQWMQAELQLDGLPADRLTTKKHYEIPPHAVATGTPYRMKDRGAFRELGYAYHDAWVVTSAVAATTPNASVVRCWPHHFDLATLITLPPGADGAPRAIGFGMTPGDQTYTEPYFYVTPSPAPQPKGLARLPVGRWHTEGWVGAVLTESSLIGTTGNERQHDRVMQFADAAIAACRAAFAGA